MTPDERMKSIDRGSLKREWARDITEACRLLFAAGADEAEVDIILDKFHVPAVVDADWANQRRAWYAKTVEGEGL